MKRLLGFLSHLALEKPVHTLFFFLLISGLAVFSLPGIPLMTSNLDLVDANQPEIKRFLDFGEKFGSPNSIIIGMEGDNSSLLKEQVDRLIPLLMRLPEVKLVYGKLPIEKSLADEIGISRYMTSLDEKTILMIVQPKDLRTQVEQAKTLIQSIKDLLVLPPGVKSKLTGIPIYAVSDQEIIQNDIKKLSLIAFLSIALIFFLGFRSFWTPIITVFWLGISVLLTAGALSLYPGRLTLLSASFASLILGLGIDFGIHITHRFEDHLHKGKTKKDSLRLAISETLPGLSTGALSTTLVFISLTFTDFLGFRELGIIGAAGILISLLVMLTAFPATLLMFPFSPRNLSKKTAGRESTALLPNWGGNELSDSDQPEKQVKSRPEDKTFPMKWCWAGTVTLGLVFLGTSGSLPAFDSNYLNLQPKSSTAVQFEKDIFSDFDISTQFAAFTATGSDEAERLIQELQVMKEVKQISSYRDFELLEEDGFNLSLPKTFVEGFLSDEGEYAIYAYPSGNIWDIATQKTFHDKMKRISETVTGMPILGYYMLQKTRSALLVSGLLSLFIITIVVWVDFRSLKWTLLALLPTIITSLALPGLMTHFGIQFNPIDIMAIPVILGISVDDGVHFIHRFKKSGHSVSSAWLQSGKSILLTSLTNLAAFGCLIFTSHRGLQSFAALLCLGILVALLVTLSVLPLLLTSIAKHSP